MKEVKDVCQPWLKPDFDEIDLIYLMLLFEQNFPTVFRI